MLYVVSNQSAIKLLLMVSSNSKSVVTQRKLKTVDQDTPWYSDRERFIHHKIVPCNKRIGATSMASDGHQQETDIKVSLSEEGTYMSERIQIFQPDIKQLHKLTF